MYPIVYFGVVHIKIRDSANLEIFKAMHIAWGMRPDDIKEVLGMCVDETKLCVLVVRIQ